MAREPGYCLHKPTGQAYVRFNGKLHYLGEYGSDESKERYNRLKAEWLVNRHSEKYSPQPTGPTVADVCLAFLDFADVYYSASDEAYQYRLAIKPLSELYATLPAKAFGVVEFRTVRDKWLKEPIVRAHKPPSKAKRKRTSEAKQKPPQFRTRQHVNKLMKRVIRIFKWGAGEGMIPPAVHESLRCVDSLKRGRTEAPEAEPVKPVPETLVDATLPHLTQVLADMVRLQQLVGCRPGELVKITPGMVDRTSKVWTITLAEHKTAYRGKTRTIYVGPLAQAVLTPYLLRGADDACFSPQESERQRLAAKHAARVTPMSCGNKPGSNRVTRKPRKAPSTAYTTGTYARAILYACKGAKLEHWHPNQLRHSAGTRIRKEYGLEAAQVILGHSGADITQIYAEKDASKAIEVALRIG